MNKIVLYFQNNQRNANIQAVASVQEPWYPVKVPYAPGGDQDCQKCARISIRKCRRGIRTSNCVEPNIRYSNQECSGTAEIVCSANGDEVVMEDLSGEVVHK
ncbi:hypothetical protein Y032_0964g3232 [Ancylostoma ceylanicum]|uniref:Uncharacterized protein n=1 Tax=Ancylostoma ceylanicum TaxID=53326 RepID=A0A016W8E7_9BILA|nr:hypothetical protein Y032_0964g3232 [Ancylostoma ceylanicum]